MAYEKTIWKNREVERPRTFEKIENPDGTITLVPAEGNIVEPGTPIIAENMNKIEQGIADAHDAIDQLDDDLALHKNDYATLDKAGHVKAETDAEGRLIIPELNHVYREIANLKLYQEATQRIENGIVFGDNFVGEPMGMEYSNLSTAIRSQQGIIFNDDIQEDTTDLNIFERDWTEGYRADAFYTSKVEKMDDHYLIYIVGSSPSIYGEISWALTQKIDFTHHHKLLIDWANEPIDSGNSGQCFVVISETINGNVNDYVKRYHLNGRFSRRTSQIDVSDLQGEYYIRVHARGRDLQGNGRTHIKLYGLKLSKYIFEDNIAIYNLPITNQVVAFIKKEGDFSIDAYANNQLMEKDFDENEYRFYSKLPEKAPVELKLVMSREVIDEQAKITRIVGGISK